MRNVRIETNYKTNSRISMKNSRNTRSILFSTLRLSDPINNNNKRNKVIFMLMFLASLPADVH